MPHIRMTQDTWPSPFGADMFYATWLCRCRCCCCLRFQTLLCVECRFLFSVPCSLFSVVCCFRVLVSGLNGYVPFFLYSQLWPFSYEFFNFVQSLLVVYVQGGFPEWLPVASCQLVVGSCCCFFPDCCC